MKVVTAGLTMVAGLPTRSPRASPTVTGPTLLPEPATSRQVFLAPEMWDELAEAAKFHAQVFRELGSREGVSRNDIIKHFLKWALEAYWADKGGRPTSVEDRVKKAEKHAAVLKKNATK